MTDGLHAHDRPADLVLARVHLRTGSLSLARAELETLAGRDELDVDGLLDLAEARWRTGDLTGAGEAAVASLDGDDGPLIALVVAAEAAAARGRPTEARRLIGRALTLADGSIDAVFAGMPRAAAWPPDASAPPPAATTLFDPPTGPESAAGRSTSRGPAPSTRSDPESDADAGPHDEGSSTDAVPDPLSIGLWDAGSLGDDAVAPEEPEVGETLSPDLAATAEQAARDDALAETDLPFGDEELERGRAALASGDIEAAAVHLSFVLRLTPALAAVVVEVVADRGEPALAFVRGDAYRLVGREAEALRSYADAVRPTDPDPDPDPDPPDPPPEGDPA